MDKIRFFLFVSGLLFAFACNTKPDYTTEIKSIDSLKTEVSKSLDECRAMDTTWVTPVTNKSSELINELVKVYSPDSITTDEVDAITYYKGFRVVGVKFTSERRVFQKGLEARIKQLDDLKKDAENGSVKKEDLNKYLEEEKNVTTELISEFNRMKGLVVDIRQKFDSLTPMIEKMIEVYRLKNEVEIKKIRH